MGAINPQRYFLRKEDRPIDLDAEKWAYSQQRMRKRRRSPTRRIAKAERLIELLEFGRFEPATPEEMAQAKKAALEAIKKYAKGASLYYFEMTEIMRGFGLFPGLNIKGAELLQFYDEVRKMGFRRIKGLDPAPEEEPVWR